MRTTLLTLAAVIGVATGNARAAPRCVINDTDTRYLFALEDATGARPVAWLDPRQRLCLEATAGSRMVGSVFLAFSALEGCSRIFRHERHLALTAYASFDNCRWRMQAD